MKAQHFLCCLAIIVVCFTACKKDKDISVTGITLNKNKLALMPGDTETLIATVQPDNATNKSVIWTSSNPAVATVSHEGMVTAVATGEATITATIQDGDKTAACMVTVEIPVTGVILNYEELMLIPGDTVTLIAIVQPDDADNKSITWTSSNPVVATVNDNGLITAIIDGETTITATTQDGNKTATCLITVKEPEFIVVEFIPSLKISTLSGPDTYRKFSFDIDQDGIDDIMVEAVNQSLYTNEYLYFKSCNDHCFASNNNNPYGIYHGYIIDEGLKWIGFDQWDFLFSLRDKEPFIAIKLLQDDGIHYGWVSVKMPHYGGDAFVIEKHAYCKIANKAITAGQVE